MTLPRQNDPLPRPLLVYGARKSGTTLVQSMLDGGASLPMVPGELKLKYIVKKRWIKSRSRSLAQWYPKAGRSIFPLTPEAGKEPEPIGGLTREQLAPFLDLEKYAAGLDAIAVQDDLTLAEILREDASAFLGALKADVRSAKFWGSKEVGGQTVEILRLFRECFPDGMLVLVLREPVYTVRSILLNRLRRGNHPGGMRSIIHEFVDAQRVLNEAHREASEGNAVIVTYEKLTADPAGESKLLCERLGIPFEEIFSRPTTLGQEMVVDTSSRQTTKVFRQVADWREGLTRKQVFTLNLCRILGPVAYRLRGKRMVPYAEMTQLLDSKALLVNAQDGGEETVDLIPGADGRRCVEMPPVEP